MPVTEHTINDALAAVLRQTRRVWIESGVLTSENTSALKGSQGRPDILLAEPFVSPVSIETEVLPAPTVESDAMSRLGASHLATGRTIDSAVAVRMPQRFRHKSPGALKGEIAAASDLEFALFTGTSPTAAVRSPAAGWMRGGVSELSVIAQAASVPPSVIDAAVDRLVNGVTETAALLAEVQSSNPAALWKIAHELKQEDGEQTRRMAATMLANAFVFHETLANGPGQLGPVASLSQLKGAAGGLGKSAVLEEWRKILLVNYWPIFDVSRRILELIPASHSSSVIQRLADTATDLLEHRLMRSHDLTGAVFQRLIVDRQFLAAYYTNPASAALLTGLAINPEVTPAGAQWSDADAIAGLRIADFACGTGTLLSTAYQRVGQLHEIAGGDIEALHSDMMATGLVGCDVLPAAAHLTASMLSGAHPTVTYTRSSILTVPFGKQPSGSVALGSVDLLRDQSMLDVLDVSSAKAAGGMGEHEAATWADLPHASFDLVVMNPPFVRATGHEGKKIGVPVPMFAAFGIDAAAQRLMSQAAQNLTAGTSAHGNAGEASIFMVVAHRKLKDRGTVALVLPVSFVSGEAWEGSRQLFRTFYDDLTITSIAARKDDALSFSADTGMGECLVVARKATTGCSRAVFVSLREKPHSSLEGWNAANEIRDLRSSGHIHALEEGPVGATPIYFGTQEIGSALDAPLPSSGSWNLARIADFTLAQTAFQLVAHGRLWLPTMPQADVVSIPMSSIGSIGTVGPYHMDIRGASPSGGIRGPFEIKKIAKGVPTFPVLWGHDADRERTMAFEAESEGLPLSVSSALDKTVVQTKVAAIWKTASHCHFSRDTRFNSQSTAMQYSHHESIGGRAWLSIKLATEALEKALVIWGNSTLGLLIHWLYSNRQQAGRGSLGRDPLPRLPCLDVKVLTADQLDRMVAIFDDLSTRPLRRICEMAHDDVRRELDERFGAEVLCLSKSQLAALDLLRRKLEAEPSIQG